MLNVATVNLPAMPQLPSNDTNLLLSFKAVFSSFEVGTNDIDENSSDLAALSNDLSLIKEKERMREYLCLECIY